MNILFVTNSIPWPPTNGMRIKTYNLLRQLSKRHRLHLLSFYESGKDNPAEAANHLKDFCKTVRLIPVEKWKFREIRVLLNMMNITKAEPFFAREHRNKQMADALAEFIKSTDIDVVHFDILCMAQYVNLIRGRLPAILSLNDCISLSYRDEAILFPNKNIIKKIKLFLQWLNVHNYEKKICQQFQKCHVVSDADKNYLVKTDNSIDVEVIPNGVDAAFYHPLNLKPDYPSLVFESVMSGGTVDYVKWFLDNVFPSVTEVIPDIKLYLVGKDPSQKLIKIASKNKNVIVTGFVEDVRPYIDKATISVCPVLRSTGILNKVLQAMAMEKAVVGTSCSFTGIKGAISGKNMVAAENPAQFAENIIYLLQNPDKRKTIGQNARRLVVNSYSWERTAEKFEILYQQAIEKFHKNLTNRKGYDIPAARETVCTAHNHS
jgi:sugar transferase (PEP-CTERM/EpsH1 system associated)